MTSVGRMNSLFEEEIRGHHSMRDQLLTVVSDDDLSYKLPGANPTLGRLLIDLGDNQGVYTHSFETLELDWAHRQLRPPSPATVVNLRAWFDEQDAAMKAALDAFTVDELQIDRIDRGGGFIASPFVQHEIYREAVYIFYGKLSVYLRALERDAGPSWTAWVG
ncbi:hypothetical protein [Promicromonospora sp. NPDC023987]|uniref:hypothetical protein n=1 Tax=Promicromonospora sp. NPDC023987 TaxID=3155360 RepID=UPI0033E60DDA